MWNDTDIPLAYLITFRCYGTWLHGDQRGSTDRDHNIYGTRHIPASGKFEEFNRAELRGKPFLLNSKQRRVVEAAIREVCSHRKWDLHATSVRTNHTHSVVSIGLDNPSRALNNFKAYSTRRLREAGLWSHEHSPWSNKGSKRYLWNARSLDIAIDYVLYGQGEELPMFD